MRGYIRHFAGLKDKKYPMWTRPPKVGVIKLILGVIFMVKYDEEFKLKLVNDYLDSDLSYVSLAKKYDIPSPSSIKNWVRDYKSQGVEGLKRKKRKSKKKAVYSVQFKLDVVQFVLETRARSEEHTSELQSRDHLVCRLLLEKK